MVALLAPRVWCPRSQADVWGLLDQCFAVQGSVGCEVWGPVVGPDGKIRWGDWLDDLATNMFPAAWRRSLPVGGVFVDWGVWSSVKRG